MFYIFFELVFSPTATSSGDEIREIEDRTGSGASSVPVSSFNVDDRTGQPVVCRVKSRKFWAQGLFVYLFIR